MPELSGTQIADLRRLKQHCDELGADLVVIGAIAYQVHFPNEPRHTGDVDLAAALDLDDFARFAQRLAAGGWVRVPYREERWRSAEGSLLDVIPAGPTLRAAKQVTWPTSQLTMSLVGFDHVFSSAESVAFSEGLTLKVIGPVVLMLLKIVAFMDDQNRRAKDLRDIRSMLQYYEEDSSRLFGDDVLDAHLADFSLAPAFLLGGDLRKLCTEEELAVVYRFFDALSETRPAWMAFVRAKGFGDDQEEDARAELGAFKSGFSSMASS